MTPLEISSLTNYLQWFGSILIFLTALWRFPNRPVFVTILGLYAMMSICFQLMQFISSEYLQAKYTVHVRNVYVLMETLILLAFFYHINSNRVVRNVVLISAIGYFIFFLFIIADQIRFMSYATRSIRDFLLIIFSLLYFSFQTKESETQNRFSSAIFWLVAYILLFFSCTFILSLTLQYIANMLRDEFPYFWAFRNFLRFLFCMAICWGLYMVRQHANGGRTKNTIT